MKIQNVVVARTPEELKKLCVQKVTDLRQEPDKNVLLFGGENMAEELRPLKEQDHLRPIDDVQ